jgi:hypothetical protein
VQHLTLKLKPIMENKNTKFWFAYEYLCGLYKLVHTSQYLHWFESFIIKSISMHLVLYEFFHAMNVVLRIQLKWPKRSDLVEVMAKFKKFCSLPSIHGAIDAT